MIFQERIQCHVSSIHSDLVGHACQISVKDNDKPDMDGAIAVARYADPDVSRIIVRDTRRRVAVYARKWAADNGMEDLCPPTFIAATVDGIPHGATIDLFVNA